MFHGLAIQLPAIDPTIGYPRIIISFQFLHAQIKMVMWKMRVVQKAIHTWFVIQNGLAPLIRAFKMWTETETIGIIWLATLSFFSYWSQLPNSFQSESEIFLLKENKDIKNDKGEVETKSAFSTNSKMGNKQI